MKITKQTILDRTRQFCAENGKNYDFLTEFNGGEDGFVAKVVEIDSRALSVKNRRLISGMSFECEPIKRCNDNGLVYWAADTGYIGCDSAEVVCRGGWMNDEKAEANREHQKEAQRVKKMFHDTYKALAEGAACLWRIAKTQHFTSYEQYENYLNKYKPAKMKQASKVLKELKLMGYDIIDEDCVECQLNYYLDSLESE